uniref:Kanamycin kinase protein n=1 Tax=Streptomyces rosa TaxID=68265 RepID=A0A0H4UQR1_9ACTN|nr:kanamycin kinase protein [Streptomyces rosa]
MSRLGIDIGGTKVALRLERSGAAVGAAPLGETFPWPAEGDVAADLRALAAAVDGLRRPPGDPVVSVGVALPAALDARGRVRGWPNRPSWAGLDIRRHLAAFLPAARVRIADDGDLAALAEARAAGCRDLVHLGVGTGIGGGVVLDGVMRPGTARGSCEVGHVIVDHRTGAVCDCGRRGCVQSLSSGRAALRRAAELLGGPVEFARLRDAWTAREDWAVEVVTTGASALAAAATSLAELTHPDVVTVGGGFAAALPGYVDEVSARFDALRRPSGPAPEIRPAALGALSSLDGAALLARGVGVREPETEPS